MAMPTDSESPLPPSNHISDTSASMSTSAMRFTPNSPDRITDQSISAKTMKQPELYDSLVALGFQKCHAERFATYVSINNAITLLRGRIQTVSRSSRCTSYEHLTLYDHTGFNRNWVLFDPLNTFPEGIKEHELLYIVKIAYIQPGQDRYLEYNLNSKAIRLRRGARDRFREYAIEYTANGPRFADSTKTGTEVGNSSSGSDTSELTELESVEESTNDANLAASMTVDEPADSPDTIHCLPATAVPVGVSPSEPNGETDNQNKKSATNSPKKRHSPKNSVVATPKTSNSAMGTPKSSLKISPKKPRTLTANEVDDDMSDIMDKSPDKGSAKKKASHKKTKSSNGTPVKVKCGN